MELGLTPWMELGLTPWTPPGRRSIPKAWIGAVGRSRPLVTNELASSRADDRGSAQCGLRRGFSRGLWPNRRNTHQSPALDATNAISVAADHPLPSCELSIKWPRTGRSRTGQSAAASRVEANATTEEEKSHEC